MCRNDLETLVAVHVAGARDPDYDDLIIPRIYLIRVALELILSRSGPHNANVMTVLPRRVIL